MEAVEALGRRGLSTHLEAVRELARSRSFQVVAGLTVLAAALRFPTLGLQSYHHDEVVTASRVLGGNFWDAMEAVWSSESAPPLYYALAWLWTQLTGTAELGLRSFSAVAGIATTPVAYLLGAELRGRRTGIAAAALVAVNPMLVWYSQEARAYALLVLLTSLAALYFVRALEHGRRRDARRWAIVSALALATHYFAVFPVALEALWLLHRRGRAARPAVGIVAAAGLLLAPLAILQMVLGHAEWIGEIGLGHRLRETAVSFVAGETGDVIAEPEQLVPAIPSLLAIASAMVLLALRGEWRERRGAGRMLAIMAAALGLPLVLALAGPGQDFVFARNLLPALVPLLVATAIAATLRRARRSGALLASFLAVSSLGFCIWASASPALQRPDWAAVAERLGPPRAPRATVTWLLGEAPLRYYLSDGSLLVLPGTGQPWFVHEVNVVSNGPAPPVPARLLGPGFRQVAQEPVGRLYLRRYALKGSGLAPLRLAALMNQARLGFLTNGVLLDGIDP
jgi:mannosyltransferase